MPLVFGHQRLDLGQFPDLMPQRFGVAARELRAAAATGRRFEDDDFRGTRRWRIKRPLVLGMAGLAATFAAAIFSFCGDGLACGCCELGGSEELCGVF